MQKWMIFGGGGFLALLLGAIIGGLIGHFGFPVYEYGHLTRDADLGITQRIINEVDGDNIASYLKHLSAVPHVAGTKYDYEQALWVKDQLVSSGIDDVEIIKHKVLLSYPPNDNPNQVQITDPAGLTYNFSAQQPVLFSPEEGHPDINSNFLAYSAQGQVSGDVVYAYHGRPDDFKHLEDNGVNVTGKIVLARYGKIFRGNIVLEAEKRGASGVLLFSDPKDFSPRGRNQVYPNTVDLPEDGVQSGTLLLSDGDPLTPHYPSIDSAYFDDDSKMMRELPRIPAQPIGYKDAEYLLQKLGGKESPQEWKGDLTTDYKLGGTFVEAGTKLTMDIRTTREVKDTYTVIGTIPGSVEKDRYVLLGNHRDSWSLGSIDPSSGTACLLEIARVFGKLAQEGWRPRRTLKFCSWGAEEYGLIGSTEWVEQNRKILEKQAVAYINVDIAVEGNYTLYAKSVPMLYKTVIEATKKIPNPNPNEVTEGRTTIYDTWLKNSPSDGGRPKIYGLGSGSDFKAFIHNIGVPALDLRYTYEENIGSYPLYHTLYETYHLLSYLYDEGMAFMKSITQLWGEAARILADSLIIPFDVREYASYINKTFSEVESSYKNDLQAQDISLDNFRNAVAHFDQQATRFLDIEKSVDLQDPLAIRSLNDKLMLVERMFIDPLGVSDRADIVNHILFAPSIKDTYASVGFAGLTDLIEAAKESGAAEDWENVKKHLSVIVFMMQEAGNILTSI
ncbi:putative N-acetylated-alpha-linked acidic dipeptidase [Artemia franciscana]